MDQKIIVKRLFEYNSILKENDNLYHNAAKILGISDCALWILYVLREEKDIVTQSYICDVLHQPKQTVNSALKKLEAEGILSLGHTSDNRSKQILLTQKGESFTKNTADKVIAAENAALSCMTDDEQAAFIALFRKYTNLLKFKMRDELLIPHLEK